MSVDPPMIERPTSVTAITLSNPQVKMSSLEQIFLPGRVPILRRLPLTVGKRSYSDESGLMTP